MTVLFVTRLATAGITSRIVGTNLVITTIGGSLTAFIDINTIDSISPKSDVTFTTIASNGIFAGRIGVAWLIITFVDVRTGDTVAVISIKTRALIPPRRIGTARVITAVVCMFRAIVDFLALGSIVICIPIAVGTYTRYRIVFNNALRVRIAIERFAIFIEYALRTVAISIEVTEWAFT